MSTKSRCWDNLYYTYKLFFSNPTESEISYLNSYRRQRELRVGKNRRIGHVRSGCYIKSGIVTVVFRDVDAWKGQWIAKDNGNFGEYLIKCLADGSAIKVEGDTKVELKPRGPTPDPFIDVEINGTWWIATKEALECFAN